MMFSGDIEVDESCFGSRTKYHRGKSRGMKIWVVGLIERSSNRIILYPVDVDNRDAATLTRIIQRHVEPGSNVNTDGWSAYNSLNHLGFNHFTVVHKYTFKQKYYNTETGNYLTLHTNRLEGTWKHAKDYFKKMNGSNINNFESHLSNIVMWNHHSISNRYDFFFYLLEDCLHIRRTVLIYLQPSSLQHLVC